VSKDWRLENTHVQRMRGQVFALTQFHSSENWDHEHCLACWQKFAEVGVDPDALQEGYLSQSGEWICPQCFIELREALNWKAIETK
jgi:hypothetical protein